jgi:GTP diphosphokinase / guanosine-3',5'-bis(diphosphate) 3'-diphosphatase
MAMKELTSEHVALAEQYCMRFHEGQFRKAGNLPYSDHPKAVAQILKKYGYNDPLTQIIALLHDAVEDSELKMDQIQEVFGYEVSNGVYILSRNKGKMRDGKRLSHDDYLQRLFWARNKIKRVKIADMIDNTRDLQTLPQLSIERIIDNAKCFYIPLGREIAPIMVNELCSNLENYQKKRKMIIS